MKISPKTWMVFMLLGVMALQGCCKLFKEDCECDDSAKGIYGTITNSTSQKPIQQALITLSGSEIGDIIEETGSDGTFHFPTLEPGEYQLSVTKGCFVTDIKSIQIVTCDEGQKYDFKMTPENFASPNNLDFGTSQVELSVNVTNCHAIPLEVFAQTDKGWMTIYPSSFILNAGGNVSFTVKVDRSLITTFPASAIINLTFSQPDGSTLASEKVHCAVNTP